MSDIQIAGATFSDVPTILVPKVGGGYAEYNEKPELHQYVIRPDAELVQRWDMDQYLVADQGIELPAYSTTAKTLKATANLSPTIPVDQNYNYYVVERMLAIPEYSEGTKAKGREEFFASSYLYEFVDIPANRFAAQDGSKAVTSRTLGAAGQGFVRMMYWSSASAVTLYTATTYGIAMGVTAPTISTSVITVKTPTELIRGSTTYLTSAMWALLTDIRFQYVIEAYRAPKNNLNVDGWGLDNSYEHLLDCYHTEGRKLT